MTPALYSGVVRHARLEGRGHRLKYRLFMVLVDVDAATHRTFAFARNAAALLSFHDRDHGDGSGEPLRPQIEALIRAEGVPVPGGAMHVLSMPRVLGRGFNPLSVYYCRDPHGRLAVVVYEVNNTFGDRHFYVLPARAEAGRVRQACDKDFFVSPFMDADLAYAFDLREPAEAVHIGIRVSRGDKAVLTASFAGRRKPFSQGALLVAWATHPLQTVGVLVGIYFEGLKLLLKGFRWRSPKAEPGFQAGRA